MELRGFVYLLCLLLVACTGDAVQSGDAGQSGDATSFVTIRHAALNETSGLARSLRYEGRFWAHNDSGGAPLLHAFGKDGMPHGSVRIDDAVNVDWEDMASFEKDGRAWLLIGDIGDNAAMRPVVTLYLVEEPEVDAGKEATVTAHRRLRFRYPDGPRDAESLAVDTVNGEVLVLSKRDIPAVLYSIALDAGVNEIQTATRRMQVDAITQPTAADIERAPAALDWYWQPTAMDLSGNRIAILTYRGVFIFRRPPTSNWTDALHSAPQVIGLGNAGIAESIAFGTSPEDIYVTVERPYPPLLHFKL